MIKLPEVLSTVGMGRTAWYEGIKDGKYPKPIKRGRRDAVWLMSEIQKVISDAAATRGISQTV
jgi:predicted DNA-binding transcriptional regulator AlpA